MGLLDFLKMPRSDNPNRKASLQGRSQVYNLLDNIIGFDDDRVTAGEAFGAVLRDDPVGLLSSAAQGVKGDLDNLMFEGGAMERPQDVLGYAAAPMAPGARGLLSNNPNVMNALLSRKDASNIFGAGSSQARYGDESTGGYMDMLERPDGSASTLELFVPEDARGQGGGKRLLSEVMGEYPRMGGQVSSKAAAKNAYAAGRRPYGQPDATLEDVFAAIDDMSSVNLITPNMQPTPPSPAPRNEAEAMAQKVLETRAAGIKAYHGSPHDFDEFSIDAIGTGEGAQAYGHGLYFASAEDVAKKYRDDLSGWSSAGAERTLEAVGGDVDLAIFETQQKLGRLLERNETGAFEGAERNFNMQRQIQEDKIAQLEKYKKTGSFDAGSMYEVNINANPEDFLDWDIAGPEQSANVRKALTSIANKDPQVMQAFREAMQRGDRGSIYESILQDRLGDVRRNQESAAKRLQEEGILGIKYLDAGSRGTDAATQNFVVFDDKLISIVRKYGIAGAAAMLGVSTMDVNQAMAQGLQQQGLISPPSEQPTQRQGLLQ